MPDAQDTALAEIEALSTSIWSDLSEHSGGISWWADYEMEAADLLDLSDYLYGVAEGVGTNLKLAETYLSEYRNKRATLDFQLRGYARTHVDEPIFHGLGTTAALKHIQLMAANVYGFFNAATSVLDTLAGTVIGVAGLSQPLVKADLGMFTPFASGENYPDRKQRVGKALSGDDSARAAQVSLVRAFRSSLEHAGPSDWHQWVNHKRNQLAHRGGRLELGTFGFGKNSWDVEHHIVFDREPSLTTTQSFRNARVQHVESVYLLEDQQATMKGVLGSLQAAVIGTIVPCRSLWDLRRTNPELIDQPARQWVNPTEWIDFPGYQPNPDFYKHQNAMVVNPKDATRLGASRILENTRSSNPPTRR